MNKENDMTERKTFYIDVGSMDGPRAQAHIEKIKKEISDQRFPSEPIISEDNE